jgi:hypothetical protein
MRLTIVVCVLALAGCHSKLGGIDASVPPDAGSAAPTAAIDCTPDLVGLRTNCDGSGSSDAAGRALSYAWSLTSVPSGSTLTDSGADPSFAFVPDRGGDYEVTLTVTTADGASATATATATVPTLALFYRQSTITKASDEFALGVVRSDGTGAHAIGCATTIADPSGGDAGAGNRGTYGDTPGAFGTRARYATGAPTRVVFEDVTAAEHQLLITDEDGDCSARPPLRLDATPAAQHLFPRFSPDGTRVAWIDVASPSQVVTAALDGSARHVVRSGGKVRSAPPVWLDDGHLAWVEDTSSDATPHLVIASAADADGAGDGAGVTTMVDCPAATDPMAMQVINQFVVLSDGAILLAGGTRSRTANPPGATNLYRLAGTSCSAQAATALATEAAGGFAWDFAVSPDGKTVVMAAAEGSGASAHDLFLVPSDGSLPPSRFVGSAPGVDDVGPIWLADGRQLAWTQGSSGPTPIGGGIMIANRDGSGVRSLLAPSATDGGAAIYVTGALDRGLDCSAAGTGAALGDALLLLFALFWRRRRA